MSSSAAAAPLPANIRALLTWWGQIVGAEAANDADSGVVPGSPLLRVAQLGSAGLGLVLTRDVDGEVELLRCPASSLLRTSVNEIGSLLPADSDTDPFVGLALTLLRELSRGKQSRWEPYLSSLPTTIDSTMFWSGAQRAQLKGCSFADQLEYFDPRAMWSDSVLPFMRSHADKSLFSPRVATFDRFTQACGWILSRAFRPKFARPDEGPIAAPTMLPLLDLCNTTSLRLERGDGTKQEINAQVVWLAGGEDGSGLANPIVLLKTLPASRLKAGSQIFIPYDSSGCALPNRDLLRRYGFVEGVHPHSENTHDVVALRLQTLLDDTHGRVAAQQPQRAGAQDAEHEEREAREVRKRKQQEHEAERARTGQAATKRLRSPPTSPGSGGTHRRLHSNDDGDSPAESGAVLAQNGEDENEDDDEDPDPASSGLDYAMYAAQREFLDGLPFDQLDIPSSGEPPLRLLQLLSLLGGETRAQRRSAASIRPELLGCLAQADAEEAERTEWRRREQAKRMALQLGAAEAAARNGRASVSSQSAVASVTAASASASAASSASADPSPLPPAADDPYDSGLTPSLVSQIDSRSRDELEHDADVHAKLFAVLHTALAAFDTTLEEDVALAAQLQEQGAEASEDESQRRLLLAIRMRMVEKRLLYRCLRIVETRLRSLDAQHDAREAERRGGSIPNSDDEAEDPSHTHDDDDDGECDMQPSDGVGPKNEDPNILDPRLIRQASGNMNVAQSETDASKPPIGN